MVFYRKLSTPRVIAYGFALIILLGALLLSLPAANRGGVGIPFLNALFTACSATCVTGLVVYDTWVQFTGFGQAVILVLIQMGGLGFMTFAILFSMMLGRRIGLKERIDIAEAIASGKTGGVVRLTRRILLGTLIVEGTGAVLLSIRFVPLFGWGTGIWYGVFHAVSAFCNAGFDLMGRIEPYSSLVGFVGDWLVNLTVMALIFIGGIGFIVWDDVAEKKLHFRRYSLHTKLALTFSGGAILLSALLFLGTEGNAAFARLHGGERVLAAFFAAVTPRTAGFNTTDYAVFSNSGMLLTYLLMIIGAGSGSTGGGVKVTTFSVLFFATAAYLRQRTEVSAFGRRVDNGLVRKAFCAVLLYMGTACLACFLICIRQPLPLRDVLFECFSALGTVGLSTGITRQMASFSRLILILLMFVGRVGSLTVFMAMSEPRGNAQLRYPAERVIIG